VVQRAGAIALFIALTIEINPKRRCLKNSSERDLSFFTVSPVIHNLTFHTFLNAWLKMRHLARSTVLTRHTVLYTLTKSIKKVKVQAYNS